MFYETGILQETRNQFRDRFPERLDFALNTIIAIVWAEWHQTGRPDWTFCRNRLAEYPYLRWPTRYTLSPWKSIDAPCKIGCYEASPYKNWASPWKIRCFSAQIECFSVENSIFLRINQKFLRGKFDVSLYKSKVSQCKIRCFSVQIESDRKLLRGKLHSEVGDLGCPPRPTNRWNFSIMFRGKEVVLFVKTLFLPLRNGVVLLSLRQTFPRKC